MTAAEKYRVEHLKNNDKSFRGRDKTYISALSQLGQSIRALSQPLERDLPQFHGSTLIKGKTFKGYPTAELSVPIDLYSLRDR